VRFASCAGVLPDLAGKISAFVGPTGEPRAPSLSASWPVRKGKIIVGVTHMPPWPGILPQELAWAIQVFIESRGAGSLH